MAVPGMTLNCLKKPLGRINNASYFGNYSAAQTIGVIGIVLGVTLMFYLKKNFGHAGRSKSISVWKQMNSTSFEAGKNKRNKKMIKLLMEKIKKNHALAMILCCGIPIVGIMALSFLGILGSWGYYALLLVCPVGHLLMMRGMHSNSEENMVPRQIEHKTDESLNQGR